MVAVAAYKNGWVAVSHTPVCERVFFFSVWITKAHIGCVYQRRITLCKALIQSTVTSLSKYT